MRTSRSTDEEKQNSARRKRVFLRFMKEKLAITYLVIMLALFALAMVLYFLIRDHNEEYSRIVLSQRSTFDSRTLPYRRGDIVDRNGTYLATSSKVYNLIIDARQLYQAEEQNPGCLELTLNCLCESFGYNRADLEAAIEASPNSRYIRYERRIDYEKKIVYDKNKDRMNGEKDSEEKPDADLLAWRKEHPGALVSGIWFEEEYKRSYPYGSLACNVIGFCLGDGTSGTGGIEQYYNSVLNGTNGRKYGYLNDDSNMEAVVKQPVNGHTIISTIDVNVQNQVEERIRQWNQETGSEHIGVIVMNPNNGEILAMATGHPYDLNDPWDVSAYYSEEELAAMADDTEKQVEAWNQIWRNYCVSDTFEPGSPSKVFTVAAGLEENNFDTGTRFFCDGYQTVGPFQIKCTAYSKGGHGSLSVEEALMVSCNDAMMQMAAMEGKTAFKKYQDLFNFGASTGIDLPGEETASSLVYKVDNMDASSLATNSFGQNYNCTMVQMAAAFSSVINGGTYYEPHVVKQIINDNGAIVRKNDGVAVRETVSDSTSRFLREALRRVVADGTGKAAAVAGYNIGGKTGTAERLPRNHRDYTVSFCGFAPTEDPQVLVYVVIDRPHVEDQAHSTFASNVFSQIMGDILPYLNVFPAGETETTTIVATEPLPEKEGLNEPEEVYEHLPFEEEEYVPQEYGEDGSLLPSDLPTGLSGDEEVDGLTGEGGMSAAQKRELIEVRKDATGE